MRIVVTENPVSLVTENITKQVGIDLVIIPGLFTEVLQAFS